MCDTESPRLRQFYEKLAAVIPCQPEEARAELLAMSRKELLVKYLNWADRIILPRPRRVITWDGIHRHGSAARHWDAVCALGAEIEAGNDLTPYLSDKVFHSGYVGAAAEDGMKRPRGIEWEDKDYALNAYEMHHLHLDRSGTEHLLFANFSRHDAFFLMVGDHKSFDDGSLARAVVEARVGTSYEAKGLLASREARPMREYNQVQRRGYATFFPTDEGGLVMGAMLSRAGTSTLHTLHANQIARKIMELEARIDEPDFGRDWFEQMGRAYPASPAFEWAMNHCEPCLLEPTALVKIQLVPWRR